MVEVGVHHPYELPVQRFAPIAERAGFSHLAHGEHILFDHPLLNAFVGLSVAAACTSRIRLLSAVTLLPLYPAALAAKLAASLDVASGGRFDFGVGVGGDIPAEFDLCQVDLRSRGRRTDEALDTIQALFADEPAQPRRPRLLPKPLQRPGPPLWVAGRSQAAIRRAARYGATWLPYLVDPERLAAGARGLAEHWAGPAGGAGPRVAVSCTICVSDVGWQAERQARAYLADLYGVPERVVAGYAVGGTVEQVQARLSEFVEAGADVLLLQMAARDDEAIALAQRVGAQLRPALAQNRSGS